MLRRAVPAVVQAAYAAPLSVASETLRARSPGALSVSCAAAEPSGRMRTARSGPAGLSARAVM